ncbi:MAG: hypothetical protein P8J87_15120 [Verrucomicrobiales bacterium]|nr:hypothetical protein [Verrucomicrobiales bacterium]
MKFSAVITQPEFDELLRPKLRLFLSVDVVGSANFKNRRRSAGSPGSQEWLTFFVPFYNAFPNIFTNAIGDLARARGIRPPATPDLWKSLGDELLFTTELVRTTDADFYLTAFRDAINLAVTHFASTPAGNSPVALKGGAWLAGFPVTNAAVPLKVHHGDAATLFDYVGPQVDLGFRIRALATPRKLVMSCDLAYLILTACPDTSLDLRFFGREKLKGILGGKPYPIFWANTLDGPAADTGTAALATLEDAVSPVTAPRDHAAILAFATAYLESLGGRFYAPFIAADPHPGLPQPDSYEESLHAVADLLASVLFIRSAAEESGEETVPSYIDHWQPPSQHP